MATASISMIHSVCAHLGGLASARELAARGIGRAAIASALRAGAIERVRRGLYIASDAPDHLRTAVAHGGVLGCASVARESGLWVLPLDEHVHVALRPHGHVTPHAECSCVSHWGEVDVSAGRVNLVDALAQLLLCLGEDAFFAALESALRQRRLGRAELSHLKSRIAESRSWLVDLAGAESESGLESLMKVRMHRLGITLAAQVEIPGVGRVDFVLGDRLIIEVDGRPGHESRESRHKDRIRDAVAAGLGFDTLRFDYALVVHDWSVVEAAILEKCRRGLHIDGWAESVREAATAV
jgi:very-short-patch-repair endonuclease